MFQVIFVFLCPTYFVFRPLHSALADGFIKLLVDVSWTKKRHKNHEWIACPTTSVDERSSGTGYSVSTILHVSLNRVQGRAQVFRTKWPGCTNGLAGNDVTRLGTEVWHAKMACLTRVTLCLSRDTLTDKPSGKTVSNMLNASLNSWLSDCKENYIPW